MGALRECAAGIAGVLLAGNSRKAYQTVGDAYLLPSIAAVVIGGTNILGGQGRYRGTIVGVILIVLLNGVLSIMEMPEAGRQVIHGRADHPDAVGRRARGARDELRGYAIFGSRRDQRVHFASPWH